MTEKKMLGWIKSIGHVTMAIAFILAILYVFTPSLLPKETIIVMGVIGVVIFVGTMLKLYLVVTLRNKEVIADERDFRIAQHSAYLSFWITILFITALGALEISGITHLSITNTLVLIALFMIASHESIKAYLHRKGIA